MNTPETSLSHHAEYSFKVEGCFRLAKINERIDNCQDYCLSDSNGLRIAISDGATQSFYSGLWSHILCDTYCSWPDLISPQNWFTWHETAQALWSKEIIKKLEILKTAGKPSWIECQNGLQLKREAFATFVGISVSSGYIHGICIGDSYAMLVRLKPASQKQDTQTRLASIDRIFPGKWEHSFSSRTIGLSSYKQDHPHMPEFFDIPIPNNNDSYRILLMTDALAEYTLKLESDGLPFISRLISLASESRFAEYIAECRKHGLANDDTSLLVAKIVSKSALLDQPDSYGGLTCGVLEQPNGSSEESTTYAALPALAVSSPQLLPALPDPKHPEPTVHGNNLVLPPSSNNSADLQTLPDSSSVVNERLGVQYESQLPSSSPAPFDETGQNMISGSNPRIVSNISFQIQKSKKKILSLILRIISRL